jgi:hypothetical protein
VKSTPSPRTHHKPSRLAGLVSALALTFTLAGCAAQTGADFPERPAFPAFTAGNLPSQGPKLAFAPEVVTSDVPFLSAAPKEPAVRMWTEWEAEAVPGYLRTQRAHEARLPVVHDLYSKAGVAFPPAQMAFVAYKAEKEIEVWASAEKGGTATKIATYGICAASGQLGPKRYEGDYQVPEGFYVIQYGWAESNYHLEMKVSYPNMVDKVLGPKNRPLGGEIMIHGACASIGCMAMSDERAEELWVMMKAMGDAQVKVHIYPSRNMDALLADPQHQAHHSFWRNLKEGKDLFERERRIPAVKADWHGVYMFE